MPNNTGFSFLTWRANCVRFLPVLAATQIEKCSIYRTKSARLLGDAGDQIFKGVSVYEEQPEKQRQNGKFAWKGGEKEGKEPQICRCGRGRPRSLQQHRTCGG